jgi:hypothetical protein
MKKTIKVFVTFLITGIIVFQATSLSALAETSAAQSMLNFAKGTAIKSGLTASEASEKNLYDIIAVVINVILGLVGVIFFVQMLWAGFKWMTSAGNEQTVKESKEIIKTSIIGVAVIFLSFFITNFVFSQLQNITG